jgi:hypothetical protein
MYNWLNFIDYLNTRLINIQTTWRVGGTFSTGCTKAIISLRELLRFTGNPFRVDTYPIPFPQVFLKAIHIQPLWGYLAPLVTAFGTLIRYQQNPL